MMVNQTLPPDLLTRSAIDDILKRWQTSGQSRWRHIDAALLAQGGMVWQAMQSILRVLNTTQPDLSLTGKADSPLGAVVPASASQFTSSPGDAAYPDTPLDALRASLHGCAEQLARLPVAWADLRHMLHLLASELRHTLEQALPPSPADQSAAHDSPPHNGTAPNDASANPAIV